jgi:hypothetical protein
VTPEECAGAVRSDASPLDSGKELSLSWPDVTLPESRSQAG